MKAILLAAGVGRRLAPLGWDRPKCLLPCPGGTLLNNMIEACAAAGIDQFAIVVGYQSEQVEQAATRHRSRFTFVANREFATTNTLYSLYVARDHLHGGVVLINGDVWFDRTLLTTLLACGASSSKLAVDAKKCGAEEVKVVTDSRRRIRRIGKDLPPAQCAGEYVGIGYFDRTAAEDLTRRLVERAESAEGKTLYFESAVEDLLDTHVVEAAIIQPNQAFEIDTPEDYRDAERIWQTKP